jgi:hypothetical protein
MIYIHYSTIQTHQEKSYNQVHHIFHRKMHSKLVFHPHNRIIPMNNSPQMGQQKEQQKESQSHLAIDDQFVTKKSE